MLTPLQLQARGNKPSFPRAKTRLLQRNAPIFKSFLHLLNFSSKLPHQILASTQCGHQAERGYLGRPCGQRGGRLPGETLRAQGFGGYLGRPSGTARGREVYLGRPLGQGGEYGKTL